MTSLPSYKVGTVSISPGLVLAPMSGVTCPAFRRLVKELNGPHVGLLVTEFISVEALTRKVGRSLEMMRFKEIERPFAVQIFGYDPRRMSDAARMAQDSGADILDINCGCPAPKVVRKGGGCELMRQPDHLASILKEVRSAIRIPLTLKMRSGWDDGCRNSTEIARICEAEGVEALAVHGRTRAQLYRGEADWNAVWDVRNAVKIPVLGSGDIVDRRSAEERLFRVNEAGERQSLAGALIGRGAISNPLIFTELVTGIRHCFRETPALAVTILRRYAALLEEEMPKVARAGKIKQLASQMLRGLEWRKPLLLANTFVEQVEILDLVQEKLARGNNIDQLVREEISIDN